MTKCLLSSALIGTSVGLGVKRLGGVMIMTLLPLHMEETKFRLLSSPGTNVNLMVLFSSSSLVLLHAYLPTPILTFGRLVEKWLSGLGRCTVMMSDGVVTSM